MEFWIFLLFSWFAVQIAVVIGFIVQTVRGRKFRERMDETFEELVSRLRRTETEMDALRRAHVALVARVDERLSTVKVQAPPEVQTAAREPLANAKVILVAAPAVEEKPAPAAAPPPKPPVREGSQPISVPRPPVVSPLPPTTPTPPPVPPVRPSAPSAVAPQKPPNVPAAEEKRVAMIAAGTPEWMRTHPVTREAPIYPTYAPPAEPQKPLKERVRATFDLEEKLGANYLAKLGVASLVIGVALFLIYQFGGTPSGKVFLGYLGGALGLGGGVWLERKERYRLFARSLMGGGWSLLYFTTYAMHHVAAARVLTSQWADLVLMLTVASAMVAHTLKYKSQVVTGLAFTLAFLTVTISHSDVYSLSAGAVLALALVIITAKLRWFELEVFGLLGAYINHLLWLYPLVSGYTLTPSLFIPSTALLTFYWAVFRASYVVRRVESLHEESVSTLACLLNSTLLLGLMKYQSLHPEWAFYALLGFGAVELVLGQLPITRRRRMAFLMLTTIGVALIVAAFPFRYSNATLSLTWLLLSQLLLAAGILTREVHFRRLGLVTATAAAAVIAYQAGVARNWELVVKSSAAHEALVFAIAGLLFYLDAHLVPRFFGERITSAFEHAVLRLISYFGFVMSLATVAVAFDTKWFAISAGVLALGFACLAAWLRDPDFVIQAPLYSAVAIVSVAALNTYSLEKHFNVTFRAIAYGAVAALLYAAAFFHGRTKRDEAEQIRGAHTWMASILVGGLIWLEAPATWIAVGWMAFALVLMLSSRAVRMPVLNLQSNVAAMAAITRVALFNLPATGLYHHDTLRLVTVLSIAVALYATARWADTKEWEWTHGARHVYTIAASTLISVLAWYELQPTSVVPAWTAFAVLLFEAGMVLRSLSLRMQGYAVITAAFVRIFFVNLNATGGGWLSPRVYTVVPVALALYFIYARVVTSREAVGSEDETKLADFATYFAAVTVASLLRFEVAPDWVAAAWAVFGAVLLAAAVMTKRMGFAYQSIILAGAVIVRGLMFNVAQRSSLAGEHVELVPVGAAVLIMLCALPLAFYLRRHPTDGASQQGPGVLAFASRHPEQFFFFIPVALVTVLLWVELPSFRTMAWGIEGMLVFLLALWAGERSFRLTGLGLLLLCAAKIVCMDAWSMEPRDRYLTLIVMGLVLLTVSFLYNRYREALRKLL